MGVTFDYFRAADAAAAVHAMALLLTDPRSSMPLPDVVETKIEYSLALPSILPSSSEQTRFDDALVWSEDDDPDASFVVQLDDRLRDTLAATVGVRPSRSAGVATTEIGHSEPLLYQLAELARRAQVADEHLFCWCCP